MTGLVVRELEGIIQGEEEDIGFVEMDGDMNGAAGFTWRAKAPRLKKGTPVDVVALLFVHKDGSYGHNQVFGIKTKKGQVVYDLRKDDSEKIPYMPQESRDLFPEAKKILYGECFEDYMKNRDLEKEMYNVAGKDLVERMIEVLGKENYLEWFYSPNTVLNNKKPYDFCKEGKQSEVDDLIGRLEHGVFS